MAITRGGKSKSIILAILLLAGYYIFRHEGAVPEIAYFVIFTIFTLLAGLLIIIGRSSESDYKSYIQARNNGTKIPENSALMKSIIKFTIGFVIFMFIAAVLYAVWDVNYRV